MTETTIAATQAALLAGRTSCRAIVAAYFARIDAYDQQVPGTQASRTRASHPDDEPVGPLNSIVTRNPEVFADAARCDRDLAHSHRLLPLSGVAVIIKDNYDTRGLQTTGGSLAMRGFQPATDATMVAKLRAAGALILGKSNMAEWAFSPYVTASSIAGITRNPYDLARVPAGSSGGTAAAVAASLAEVGLGTDTGNSIRGPSSHNDLVGIRPTIGLTSRAGIIPLFANNDVGGPMARSVADAATLLTSVAGADPSYPVTELARERPALDYKQFLEAHALRGARIGVFRQYFDTPTTDPEVKAVTESALAELQAQGAVLVDPFTIPEYASLTKDLWCGDFASDLNNYLARHPGAPYRDLQAIVDSGLYLPYIAEQMHDAVNPKPAPDDRRAPCPDVYHDPPKIAFRAAVLAAMDRAHLDAIVYPTWSNAPRKVGDITSPAGDNSQVLSPQTGFPAITVPMGFTHGMLPAGLTFFGRAFSEGPLIRLAYSYEQATHHREPPPLFPPLASNAAQEGAR
ncbi:amidase [Acidipila sp. EB88]|uniref:amidase n=1 Tax=Acidipila sp. EB88 TaxID=2305226 RepID=UPI001EED05E4|nr:amidase family protein [Acidipila sp. EB88]